MGHGRVEKLTHSQCGNIPYTLMPERDGYVGLGKSSHKGWGHLYLKKGLNVTGIDVGSGFTTGIQFDTDLTTGISFTSNCTPTDAIKIAGIATDGIEISAACTNGINISGACVDGIEIGGACSATGINITSTTIARAIMIGAFGQTSNLTLTTTRNYPLGVFGRMASDENITADVRCGWFRLRVDAGVQIGTSANWGNGLKGIQGSLKFYGGTNTGTYSWVNAGVFGSLETDGAAKVFFKDGSVSAAVFAHCGLTASASDNVDIESGAVVAGIAINAGTSTASNVTVDGKFCGLYIYNDAGNQSFTYGIYMDDTSMRRALMIGEFGSASNFVCTSTNNYPVGVFCKVAADENITADIRCAWFRLRVDAGVQIGNNANWGNGLKGIQGSLKFYGGTGTGTYSWVNAGVFGSLETDGATKVAFRDGSVAAAVFAHVGLLATSSDDVDIESGAVACGVAINSGTSTASNITVDGNFAGLYIYNDAGNQAFSKGIFIDDSSAVIGIELGDMTTGININGTLTTGIKFDSITADSWTRLIQAGTSYATAIQTDDEGLGMGIQMRIRGDKASGEIGCAYFRTYIEGSMEGQGCTGWAMVYAGSTHANVWGVRGCLNFNSTYTLSGRGAGTLAQLYIPNDASVGGGTKAALWTEMWWDGAQTAGDANCLIRCSLGGNSTGYDANFGGLFGFDANFEANGNVFVNYGSDATANKGIKINMNGTIYYLMCTTSSS